MGIADIIHQNFTSETEVWFRNAEKSTSKFNVYNQFTIKVQHGRVTDKPEIVLSFDGTTKVFAKPVSEIYNFNTNLYNWIVVQWYSIQMEIQTAGSNQYA